MGKKRKAAAKAEHDRMMEWVGTLENRVARLEERLWGQDLALMHEPGSEGPRADLDQSKVVQPMVRPRLKTMPRLKADDV